MDYAALKALIGADASLVAMAVAGNDGGVADSLNAPVVVTSVQYQLTTLSVLNILGPIRGTSVMTALRAAPEFVEIVRLMDDVAAGVNLNHPDSDTMFGMLVQGAILTQSESDSILALRNLLIGKAQHILGQPVTHIDIALAWRS